MTSTRIEAAIDAPPHAATTDGEGLMIVSVRYRRLQSSRYDYGHTAVEAEAHVAAGETPDEALARLKIFVDGKLNDQDEAEKLSRTRESIAREIRGLERTRDQLVEDVRRGRAVVRDHKALARLAKEHGLDADTSRLFDDVPF